MWRVTYRVALKAGITKKLFCISWITLGFRVLGFRVLLANNIQQVFEFERYGQVSWMMMEHPVMYINHTTSFLEHIHLITFHVMNAGFGSVLDGDISYLLPSATNCVPHASFIGLGLWMCSSQKGWIEF
jgi:hypothetical protein